MLSSRKVYSSWNSVCYVKGCGSVRGDMTPDGDKISFHLFPKDEAQREQWITFCGLSPESTNLPANNLNHNASICSRHFHPADLVFIQSDSGRQIRRAGKDAIPALHPATDDAFQNVRIRNVVRKCCVRECSTNWKEASSEVLFHYFPRSKKQSPRHAETRQQWIDFAFGIDKRDRYRLKDCICSQHFLPDDYETVGKCGKRRLRAHSVPTLRQPGEHPVQQNEEQLSRDTEKVTSGAKKSRKRSRKSLISTHTDHVLPKPCENLKENNDADNRQYYQVRRILDKRTVGNTLEYLVQLQSNNLEEHTSWFLAENLLPVCQDILQEFEESYSKETTEAITSIGIQQHPPKANVADVTTSMDVIEVDAADLESDAFSCCPEESSDRRHAAEVLATISLFHARSVSFSNQHGITAETKPSLNTSRLQANEENSQSKKAPANNILHASATRLY